MSAYRRKSRKSRRSFAADLIDLHSVLLRAKSDIWSNGVKTRMGYTVEFIPQVGTVAMVQLGKIAEGKNERRVHNGTRYGIGRGQIALSYQKFVCGGWVKCDLHEVLIRTVVIPLLIALVAIVVGSIVIGIFAVPLSVLSFP